MPVSLQGRLDLPRRPRSYGFALTALADAMFQLLVFFMLSSNITPYALLPLRSGALAAPGAAPADAAAQGAGAAIDPMGTAVWSVGRDELVAGGQRLGFDRLGDLARAARAAGTARVLLVTRPEAEVQGLVRVLEALAAAGLGDVQVARAALPGRGEGQGR